MLPWIRPQAHSDFALEAARLLNNVRTDVGNRRGIPHGDDFKGREIWTASWKQSKLPDGIHKRTLVGPFPEYAKCHWCERRLRWKGELNVEHYRPKGGVTRWDGNPPLISDEPPKQIPVSTGYWWLAFTWDNYSLACYSCNTAFKRNLFPMVEPRLPFQEGVEGQEKPLLIDPASSFQVRDHFHWYDDGIMDGVSDEGRATIITCGLNRNDLLDLRAKVARKTLREVRAFQVASEMGRKDDLRAARDELARLGDRQSEFTSMVRSLFEKYIGIDWSKVKGFPA